MESRGVCSDQLSVNFHWVEFKFHLAAICRFGDDRSHRASAIGNEENFMLVLNGSAGIADVVALADRREQVSVSARVVEAVDHAHQVAAELSSRFPIYGRTTGVG